MNFAQDEEETYNLSGEGRLDSRILLSPHWQEMLDQYANNRDPWEISVMELARDFEQQLDNLQRKDFELSGRMVISCAVLLRVKAQELGEREESTEEEEFDEMIEPDFLAYEEFDSDQFIPTLEVPIKRINRRSVTKNELESAFHEAIEVHERREERREEESEVRDTDWGINLENKEGFRVRLERLYRRVKQKLSQGKQVLFSTLISRDTKEEKFNTFLELLHLQSEGKLYCRQEEPFSDILIEPGENTDG